MKRKLTRIFWILVITAILIGGLALNIWYYTAVFVFYLPAWVKFLLL